MSTSLSQRGPGEVRAEASLGSDLANVVARLAHSIERVLSRGDVAALRRMDPSDPATAAFWRLRASHLAPAGMLPDADPRREEAERRWAAVLMAMAHLEGLHAPAIPLGRALASAELAELRLVRLLQARGGALPSQLTDVARFLAAKGQAADQKDLALLMLSDGWADSDSAERVRRRIARDYYADATI